MDSARQITRQLDILRSLAASHYGVAVRKLAEEYGVSRRTIQRDLRDLQEAGFALTFEQRDDQQAYYSLLPGSPLPPLNFPVVEVLSLLFVEHLADGLEGTPFRAALHDALRRITLSLPEEMREYLARAARSYSPFTRGSKSYAESQETIDRLNQAILEQRRCVVTYHSPAQDQPRTYRIDPVRLYYFRGGLYLISRVVQYDQLITQAVERIQELKLTEETFEPPDSVSVDERLSQSFGATHKEPMDVVVRFTAEQAPFIRERIWHATQKIEELDDGEVILRFRAGGFYEIKAWVLSYGASAEVLGPEGLREAVIDELRAADAVY